MKGHELYNRYLDELELAAELGFDGVSVNEHHQNAYGLMPSPIVMAAALARRTKACKIAILGNAFGLREHPLTLAEEHAMIDVLTGGRLISGMVRGIGAEYFSFGANPAFSHARFQEAHDLVVQAWTKPGPFAFEGRHYNFEYVNVWPRPYQQPHPPIWCPSLGSTETIEWASHPSRRYVYIQNFSPVAAVVRYLNMYRQIAERTHGYTARSEQIGWAAPIYVAETDAQAVDGGAAAYRGALHQVPHPAVRDAVPAGLSFDQSLKNMRSVRRPAIQGGKISIEGLMETGIFLCGSADTVRKKLVDSHRILGFQNFLAVLQFATLPRGLTEKNLTLFAREVLPALQALSDKDYAGMAVEAAQ